MDLFWKNTKRWNETILKALALTDRHDRQVFFVHRNPWPQWTNLRRDKRVQSPRSLVGIRSPHIKQEKDTKAPYKDKLVVSKQRDVGNDRHRQG